MMDLWEELSWRLMEDFKEILRKLKKEVGRETMTLNEVRFHALLPWPRRSGLASDAHDVRLGAPRLVVPD